MKIKSRFVAAIVTFSLALMMPLSFTSCSPEDKPEVENPDKPNVPEGPETPDKPENPEPEPKPETYCYKLLTKPVLTGKVTGLLPMWMEMRYLLCIAVMRTGVWAMPRR